MTRWGLCQDNLALQHLHSWPVAWSGAWGVVQLPIMLCTLCTDIDAVVLQVQLKGDVDELLDGFAPVRRRLPKVTAICKSEWGSNPLTRGSYSYPAAGSGLADIELLAEPVLRDGRPVLLFAGEATHASHYGTASGAFLTGEREADRLLT